jgi:exosome complex RNA-binding protein Rrp42 (RNase PH superfamily)
MSAAELSLVLAALQQTPALRPDGRSLQSVRPLRLASRIVAAAAGSCEAERAGTVARAVVSAEVTEGEPAWNVAVDV